MDLVVFVKRESRTWKTCNTTEVGAWSCNEASVTSYAKSDDVGSTYVVESNFWSCSGVKVKVNPACFLSMELIDSAFLARQSPHGARPRKTGTDPDIPRYSKRLDPHVGRVNIGTP